MTNERKLQSWMKTLSACAGHAQWVKVWFIRRFEFN